MSVTTDAIAIAAGLVRVAADLFDGRETTEGARRRVREILPESSASEDAARDLRGPPSSD